MKRVMDYAVGLVLVTAGASSASAAVIAATVADVSSGNYNLTSVSVTRGAAGTFTYVPSQLIGVDLTDVDAFQTPLLIPRDASIPAPGTRATLIEDGRVDTGVINITTTNGSADRSMEVTFASPVINSAGEDILLFEYGGDDGIRWWINNDRESQGANVLTSAYSPTLISNVPFTLVNYSNDGNLNVLSLEDLESPTAFPTTSSASGNLRALGLDLSTLGVPLGGSVTSIRLQSLAGEGARVDPVFIAGLPVVPEPAGLALLALSGAVLFGRYRRRA